jgi:hypothetical protein
LFLIHYDGHAHWTEYIFSNIDLPRGGVGAGAAGRFHGYGNFGLSAGWNRQIHVIDRSLMDLIAIAVAIICAA